MLPPACIMVLLHLRVGLTLYVKGHNENKRASKRLPWTAAHKSARTYLPMWLVENFWSTWIPPL